MLNLGSNTYPVVKLLVFRVTETGHFLDLHAIGFVKNDRIAILVPIILSIN